METFLNFPVPQWPRNSAYLEWRRPLLVLSKFGLDSKALIQIQKDYIKACGENLVSVIISLKMMHVYFRLKSKTYDYRPHRGPFSRLSVTDFRLGKSERAEILLSLTSSQLERFSEYVVNIIRSPSLTLGSSHPLSVKEQNFTVRSFETRSRLHDNRLLDPVERQNCLTWFSTAPLGESGEQVLELLGMSQSEIQAEAHSYIVEFYKFLIFSAKKKLVPGVVYWTNQPLNMALESLHYNPDSIVDLHTLVNGSSLPYGNHQNGSEEYSAETLKKVS